MQRWYFYTKWEKLKNTTLTTHWLKQKPRAFTELEINEFKDYIKLKLGMWLIPRILVIERLKQEDATNLRLAWK